LNKYSYHCIYLLQRGDNNDVFFLLNYVKKFLPDIKRIELTDNSRIKCGDRDVNLFDLFDLFTLIMGISWYGKFGFILSNKELKNIIKIIIK
jgi:hypothetical protein